MCQSNSSSSPSSFIIMCQSNSSSSPSSFISSSPSASNNTFRVNLSSSQFVSASSDSNTYTVYFKPLFCSFNSDIITSSCVLISDEYRFQEAVKECKKPHKKDKWLVKKMCREGRKL